MHHFTNYVIQFIVGGTLFMILYYFTKEKNTVISSIIPAFPVVFITGYLYLLYFNGNVEIYTQNTIKTFLLDVIFIITLYILITNFNVEYYTSLITALLLYIATLYLLVKYKILK